MKRYRLFATVLLITLGCLLSACSTADNTADKGKTNTVTDVKGNTVTVPAHPKRIMSVTTGTDEILLGLVETERMIAVSEGLADPKRSNVSSIAKKIPNTVIRNPSVETVAALEPDLVFAQEWIPPEKISALRDMGIPVVICKTPRNFEDVRVTVRLIAESVGEKERGEQLLKMMDDELAELKAKIDKQPEDKKGKSIALVSIMPAYGGKGCMVDDVFAGAGAKNAKALAGNKNGVAMTKEQFVACDPDYIFLPSYDAPNTKEQKYGQEYMSDPSLQEMRAVKERHVMHPWAHYIYNISQNVVFGVQEAAYILYGDEFKQPLDRYLSAVPEDKR